MDALTDAMERRWGVGRLLMLVPDDLRERFDRQWRKWQAAYAAQDLTAVRAHSEAMRRATTPEMEALRRRVWRDQGVVSLSVEDIADPWLRQAVMNEATRRWGLRDGGSGHGR